MDIAKCEHVLESIFSPTLVAAPGPGLFRILECFEKNIPERDVGEIVCVMTELVMNAMRFRPLENVTQPRRCVNIPMVEEFADRDQDRVISGRLDAAAKQGIND